MYISSKQAYVVDVTTTSDCNYMSGPYEEKFSYYAIPDVIGWVANVHPEKPCVFGAVVLNWRGAIHHASSRPLCRLGVSAADETLMATCVLI
jgi:hypothetical protein